MSNNKKSSVELFAIALYEKGFLQGNGDKINDLLEQHKAMHKYEIEKAWLNGVDYRDANGHASTYLEIELSEHLDRLYHNETFESNDQGEE